MTLLVLGSLLPLPIVLDLRARWKALRPGELTPLVTYMSTAAMSSIRLKTLPEDLSSLGT